MVILWSELLPSITSRNTSTPSTFHYFQFINITGNNALKEHMYWDEAEPATLLGEVSSVNTNCFHPRTEISSLFVRVSGFSGLLHGPHNCTSKIIPPDTWSSMEEMAGSIGELCRQCHL